MTLRSTMHAHHANADLLPELQRRVLADLDPPACLALFCCSRVLARTVLLDVSGAKRLTNAKSSTWPPALARLLDDPQLQPLVDLELRVGSGVHPPPPPPPPPPSPIAQHVARLRLFSLAFTPASLAAWRLHDATLWPHLEHLTIDKCSFQSSAATQPLQPIPRLATFTWEQTPGAQPESMVDALLTLAEPATHLRLIRAYLSPTHVVRQALARLQRLTHADLDVASLAVDAGEVEVVEALLAHPTPRDVTLANVARDLPHLSRFPCRWRTLTLSSGACIATLARLPLAGLERLTIRGYVERGEDGRGAVAARQAGLAALQRLHGQGGLVLLPEPEGAAQNRRWRLQPTTVSSRCSERATWRQRCCGWSWKPARVSPLSSSSPPRCRCSACGTRWRRCCSSTLTAASPRCAP